jgi:hypothetical protein
MQEPGNAQAAVREEVRPAAPKERVRDSIMRTANDLFYSRGTTPSGRMPSPAGPELTK